MGIKNYLFTSVLVYSITLDGYSIYVAILIYLPWLDNTSLDKNREVGSLSMDGYICQ